MNFYVYIQIKIEINCKRHRGKITFYNATYKQRRNNFIYIFNKLKKHHTHTHLYIITFVKKISYLICKDNTSKLSLTTKSIRSIKSPFRFEVNDKLNDLYSSGFNIRAHGVILIVPPKSVGLAL